MRLSIGQWVIRSWEENDEAALRRYANNRNIWINLRDSFPNPYGVEDAKTWISHARSQVPEAAFAIASPHEPIGGIGFVLGKDIFRRSAEIGYWLAEPYWGGGITTLAVRALTDYLFEEHKLARVFATVFEWNPASGRVLEKAGFEYEGRLRRSVFKDGKIIDQFLYAVTREQDVDRSADD